MAAGDMSYVLKMNGKWLILIQARSLGSNRDYSSTTYVVEDVIYAVNRDPAIGKKVDSTYEVQDWPLNTDMKIINHQIIGLLFSIM